MSTNPIQQHTTPPQD